MTTNELRVLSIIGNWGGEASVDIVARESGFSIEYARLFCKSLAKEGYIDFLRLKLCKLNSKGKTLAAKEQKQEPKKIVISNERSDEAMLGRNKKGRLTLNY